MTKLPKIAIIFPNYNGGQNPIICLQSLFKLNYPADKIEIIVIDNNSSDGSDLQIKRLYPQVKLIKMKENAGFAKAVNKGIKASKSSYLLIANNDIVFDKNYLITLVNFMEKNQNVGITGGKIYYQKPKNKLLFTGVSFNPWTGAINRMPNPDQIKESEWIQGCAMLIKKEVVKRIGIFDPEYFFSFEDADFCLKARKAGFKVIYLPLAIAWHKESATIDTFGQRRKGTELYKAKFRYVFKNCSLAQIMSITLIQFLLIAPVRMFVVREPPFYFSSMLKGFFYNLIRLPSILKTR